LLGDVATIDSALYEVLRNVAPVDQEAVLQAIERAAFGEHSEQFLSAKNFERSAITRILRSIAWEAKYFERCLGILVKFAMAEPPDHRNDRVSDIIKSMFPIYLSGTHATKEQRGDWVRTAIQSSDQRLQQLATECLDAALETHHFSSHYGFDFGMRPRDYGYSPVGTEAQAWFESFIRIAIEFGASDLPVANQILDVLANNFRGLWTFAGQYDLLEEAIKVLVPKGWEKGWLTIRRTLKYDKAGMADAAASRLMALEKFSRPTTLVDRTQAVVLASFNSGLDITDGDDDEEDESSLTAYERADCLAEQLGQLVAADGTSFSVLLPRLVENRQGRQWRFGFGLAKGTDDPEAMWRLLVAAFEAVEVENRNIQVLNGFLAGLHRKDGLLFEQLLDEAMDVPALAEWVPLMQMGVKLDVAGYDRLLRTLERGTTPAAMYQYLGYGKTSNDLRDNQLVHLLRKIASKDGGVFVAMDVLSLHRYGEGAEFGPELLELGRDLLSRMSPAKNQRRMEFLVKRLIEKSLGGPEGEPVARTILKKLRQGLDDYSLSSYEIDDEVEALFKIQPVAALDELVGDEPDKGVHYIRRRELSGFHDRNPLMHVPMETLLAWCREGSDTRWENLAAAVPVFGQRSSDEGGVAWSEQAIVLVRNAPSPGPVVQALLDRIFPRSWSGSLAQILNQRLPLFDAFVEYLDEKALADLGARKDAFKRGIERERERESDEHRARNERFE
jgi:hypothetical protein